MTVADKTRWCKDPEGLLFIPTAEEKERKSFAESYKRAMLVSVA